MKKILKGAIASLAIACGICSSDLYAAANITQYTYTAEETLTTTEKIINGGTIVYSKPSSVSDFIDEDGAWDIEMFAKVLNIKDMGRNNMFKWLREQKILQGDNKPYQSYMKYFKVVPLKNRYAESKTLVNYQGVIFLYRRLKEQGKISLKSVDEVLKELNLNK